MQLKDIVEYVVDNRGKSAPVSDKGEYPLIEINAIGGFHPDYSAIRKYVSGDVYKCWFRAGHPKKNDILLPTVGTIGIASLMDETEGCIAQNLIALRIKPSVCAEYIYYYLNSDQTKQYLLNLNIGGVQPSIKVPHLLAMPIVLPSYKEQRAIANILLSLDNKIALNNRINHNLEEQARALYKSWFVDFEPFKDGGFVDSELGLIPDGWHVGTIYDICDVYYGAPFNSTLFNTENKGLPLIRIRDLAKQEAGVFTEERHPKGQLTHKGDILVGMDGEFSIYIWGGEDSWINQRISRFSPKQCISHFFLTETLRPQLKAVESSEVATTVIHIGKNDYDKFLAIIPPQSVLDSFYHVSEPLYLQYVENLSGNHGLSESRDILLPRLMSGSITC